MRPTFLADTYEEAVSAVRDNFNMFGEWAKHDPRKIRTKMAFEHEMADEDYNLSYFDFNQKHDLILVGSPETVREQIEELVAETGCQSPGAVPELPGAQLQAGDAQPGPVRLRGYPTLQLGASGFVGGGQLRPEATSGFGGRGVSEPPTS